MSAFHCVIINILGCQELIKGLCHQLEAAINNIIVQASVKKSRDSSILTMFFFF
jgi:hypothetical protein